MKLGRVKVLNYLNRFYNINEGSSRGVLWPVAVFPISLPVKGKKSLELKQSVEKKPQHIDFI